MQDMFTRYVNLYTLKQARAEDVSDIIIKYITQHGVMEELVSDNGPPFCSSIIKILCQVLKINPSIAPAYRPQSNGLVESFMLPLREQLTIYTSQKYIEWDQHI